MKVYVVVGENRWLSNISARAVFCTRVEAENYEATQDFDDRTQIVELDLPMNDVAMPMETSRREIRVTRIME
jgi:hypothetical protein